MSIVLRVIDTACTTFLFTWPQETFRRYQPTERQVFLTKVTKTQFN